MRFWRIVFALVVTVLLISTASGADLSEVEKLIEVGWWEDARDVLINHISESPDDSEVNYMMGKVYFLLQDYDSAEDFLKIAIKQDGSISNYHLWMGHTKGLKAQTGGVLKAMGRAKKCRDAYAESVLLDPDNIEARMSLLQFHMSAPGIAGGDKKIAYRQAEEISKRDSVIGFNAHAMLAEFKEEDYEKAESLLLQALESVRADTSINLDPYFWYGYFLNRRGRNDEAEAICFEAIGVDSSNTQVRMSLAGLYEQQELYDKAIGQFDKIIKMDSENYFAQYQKGKMYILSETNLNQAETIYKNYLTSKRKGWWPSYYGAHWRLAQVYDMQGKYDLAKAELEKGLAKDVKDDEVKKQMKELLKQVKKKAKK